jgi:hypothetical protein
MEIKYYIIEISFKKQYLFVNVKEFGSKYFSK